MKTQLNSVVLCLAALTAATPVTTGATDIPAVDRCVEIFVKEVVPADRPADIKSEDIRAAVTSVNARRSKVTLIAQGEKDSKIFGRASCVIDRSGNLIAMYLHNSEPSLMGSRRPKVLARNVNASDVRTARAGETKPF